MDTITPALTKKVKNKLVERLSYHLALPIRQEVESKLAKQGCATYELKFKRYSSVKTVEARLVSANDEVAELVFIGLPTVVSAWPRGEHVQQRLTLTFPKGRVVGGAYFPYTTADKTVLAMNKLADVTVKLEDGTLWKLDGPENVSTFEDIANHLEMYSEVLESNLEGAVHDAYEPLVIAFEAMSGLKVDELAWQALTYDPDRAKAFFEYHGFENVPAAKLWPRWKRDDTDPARWLGDGWTLDSKAGGAWSVEIDYKQKRFIEHASPLTD